MQTETPRVDNRPGAVNGPIPGLARKAAQILAGRPAQILA